jgi:hypothetical protein
MRRTGSPGGCLCQENISRSLREERRANREDRERQIEEEREREKRRYEEKT